MKSFEAALREIFGGRLRGDRLRGFRQFWRSKLQRAQDDRTGCIQPLANDNTDEVVAMFMRDGVSDDWLALFKVQIPSWRKEHRSAQASKNRSAGWAKKKKPIDKVCARRK